MADKNCSLSIETKKSEDEQSDSMEMMNGVMIVKRPSAQEDDETLRDNPNLLQAFVSLENKLT